MSIEELADHQPHLEGAAPSAPLANATPTESHIRAATTERGPPAWRTDRPAQDERKTRCHICAAWYLGERIWEQPRMRIGKKADA
jgi:hypothetical protein